MKTMKLILGLLLSSVLLLSCTIDEDKNLLFQLKDNIQVAGRWMSGNGTDAFVFKSDGTFTVKIGSFNGYGTYSYEEYTSHYSDSIVAMFTLYGRTENVKLPVRKEPNGDLYFSTKLYNSDPLVKYTQIS